MNFFTFYLAAAQSTGIVENMAYAGLVYYEKKEAEDLVTFTAAKDLNVLLEVNIILFYKTLTCCTVY